MQRRNAVRNGTVTSPVEAATGDMPSPIETVAPRSPLEICDAFIELFARAVQGGAVRVDVADFDRVCRLKKFLVGEAETRAEHRVTLSLEQMIERHQSVRRFQAKLDHAVCGIVSEPQEDDLSSAPLVVEGATDNHVEVGRSE